MFVGFGTEGVGSINAVRIDGGLANRVAIAAATGTIDIGTIQALASEEDGVFRDPGDA
jgi:hypothetical protein